MDFCIYCYHYTMERIKLWSNPITTSFWRASDPQFCRSQFFMDKWRLDRIIQKAPSISHILSSVRDPQVSVWFLHYTKALGCGFEPRKPVSDALPQSMLPRKRQHQSGKRHPSFWPLGGVHSLSYTLCDCICLRKHLFFRFAWSQHELQAGWRPDNRKLIFAIIKFMNTIYLWDFFNQSKSWFTWTPSWSFKYDRKLIEEPRRGPEGSPYVN